MQWYSAFSPVLVARFQKYFPIHFNENLSTFFIYFLNVKVGTAIFNLNVQSFHYQLPPVILAVQK